MIYIWGNLPCLPVLTFVALIVIHKYDFCTTLQCRNRQFAVVENPGLWNWTFTLKDIDGNVLAQIDRDWRGFGLEVCTIIWYLSSC